MCVHEMMELNPRDLWKYSCSAMMLQGASFPHAGRVHALQARINVYNSIDTYMCVHMDSIYSRGMYTPGSCCVHPLPLNLRWKHDTCTYICEYIGIIILR